MKLKASLIALALLAGCADMTKPDLTSIPSPNTPRTAWTEANARYSLVQSDAADFAVRCDKDHRMFLSACRMVVDELNELDRLAEAIQDDGYHALGRDDSSKLQQSITDLDDVTEEMQRLIPQETQP